MFVVVIDVTSELLRTFNSNGLFTIKGFNLYLGKVMDEVKRQKLIEPKEHHIRLVPCENRPAYRNGRKQTAVKVYTINDESTHLLIFGVPKLKLLQEVKRLCFKYGIVKLVKSVKNYPNIENFTEVYHIQYIKLSSARIAKKKLDDRSFFGGILHVCYAPELETIHETRAKLVQRRKEVHFQLNKLKKQEAKC